MAEGSDQGLATNGRFDSVVVVWGLQPLEIRDTDDEIRPEAVHGVSILLVAFSLALSVGTGHNTGAYFGEAALTKRSGTGVDTCGPVVCRGLDRSH